MSPRLRRLLPAIVLALLLLGMGVAHWLAAAGRRAAVRAVQEWQVPGLAEGRPLRELCDAHERLQGAAWIGGWSDDARLVAIELRLARFDELRSGVPELTAGFAAEVAKQPDWLGLAGDQPARLLVLFRVEAGDDGKPAVRPLGLRLAEVWVVFRPERAEAWEASLDETMAQSAGAAELQRFRLRREGDRYLLDAGATLPCLAGPGQQVEALPALQRLLAWR